MSGADTRVTLPLLGKMVARVSLVGILTLTFTFSLAAFSQAAPDAAAEVAEVLHLATIAGVEIDALSPLFLVVYAWSMMPLADLALYLYRAEIKPELRPEDTA
jgi:hypothetical protein